MNEPFDVDKFDPAKWHWPHWYVQKNNQEVALCDRNLSDKLVCGKRYYIAVIDADSGKEVQTGAPLTFRRFSYNEYVPAAVQECKAWAKEFEKQMREKHESTGN